MEKYNGKAWDDLNKAEKQLYRVKEHLKEGGRARIRYTLRSVPTLIVDEYFSVVYFIKTKSFRVFTGFMDFDNPSERCDFKTYIEAAEFLNECLDHMQEVSDRGTI